MLQGDAPAFPSVLCASTVSLADRLDTGDTMKTESYNRAEKSLSVSWLRARSKNGQVPQSLTCPFAVMGGKEEGDYNVAVDFFDFSISFEQANSSAVQVSSYK